MFFAHCPLRCSYCQNTVIAHGSLGYAVECVDLRDACLDLECQGALNVNFVTPTHYAPHVRAVVLAAREEGFSLPVVWNTGGYETVEAIRANTDVVDVYLTDFKYADPALGVRYSSVSDYPQRALEALAAMIDEVGSPVYDKYRGGRTYDARRHRSPFAAPGHVDDSMRVVRMLHERFGDALRLSLMNQYTPVLATAAQRGDAQAARVLRACPRACRARRTRRLRATARFRRRDRRGGLLLAGGRRVRGEFHTGV